MRGSCIIDTGPVTGLQGSSHLLDYSATKGAIHAFTMSLASSLIVCSSYITGIELPITGEVGS